ncbi:MAG TPA: sigma-70 family RNA polymerase sigma factor [Longimicrobiales bacterium]|nr:sigma-70 family RNA polymerase sigma factor [Longimicrobiales bacterium]
MSAPFPPVDIERFHEGDERLFAELVRAYSPRLLAYLRKFNDGSYDADLLQDVWLRAFQKRRGFDGRGSLFGWLLTICRTVALRNASMEQRYADLGAVENVLSSATPATDSDAFSERARLQQAIERLPARQREVVLLRIIEDRSVADTARTLGCAEGTVKAALHTAIRRLQEVLRENVR